MLRLLAFLLITAAATMVSCSEASPPPAAKVERPPIPVRVATVAPAPPASVVRGAGTLTLKREMALSFKVPGIIARYYVDTGDAVKEGQVLAELDQREIDAREHEAKAAFDKAQRDYARAQELFRTGAVARARLDDAKSLFDQAKARRDAVAFDKAWTRLTAPADGVVLTKAWDDNELVQPGQTILTIGDRSSGLIVTLALSDRDVVRVSQGDTATVSFAALSTPVAGKVARIAGKADPRTGAFDVEVAIDGAPQGLLSGMIGEASIAPSRTEPVALLAVPSESIIEGEGVAGSVFLVDAQGGVARRRAVELAGIAGDMALVRTGLTLGDEVVTAGAPYLRDGDSIEIVATMPAAPPAPR